MKLVAKIDLQETADGRYFAHVTLPNGKEVMTADVRTSRIALVQANTVIERHGG